MEHVYELDIHVLVINEDLGFKNWTGNLEIERR